MFCKWFRCKEEIKYTRFLPEDECPLLIVRAISSINGKIAHVQCVMNADDQTMLIGDLIVDEKYRNRGIGSKLLEEIMQIAKNLGVVEVYGNISSVDDTERLFTFYGKRGFEVEHHIDPSNNYVARIRRKLQ